MPDKTIKHFIFMRFFNRQVPSYPHDVLDVDFLSKQLFLVNNALRSLENQTNKNFELVFLVHEKFLTEKKYEFIFSTLKDSTVLPLKFVRVKDYPPLVIEAFNNYEFVIQSRLDFDDFIFKDAISDTQSKVNECDKILAYGYCKGYTYVWGELYPYFSLWNKVGHYSLLQSFILKSSFAKDLPFIGIHNLPGIFKNMYNKYISHTRIKTSLQDFLEQNGIEFTENMFQQNTTTDAYIYFRHEFSQDQFQEWRNLVKPPKNKMPLTNKDITKKQLKEEFGFFYDVKLGNPYVGFYLDKELDNPYIASRIDIKLISDEESYFQILSVSDNKADVWRPIWFQKGGVGYQIQSYAGNMEIIAKTFADGQFKLSLRGLDVRDSANNSKRVPYWVNYTKLTINDKIIFDKSTSAWHDKTYNYGMYVKAGQEIKIQVEWLPCRSYQR